VLCSGRACSVPRMTQDGNDGGFWIGGEGRTASGVEIDDPDLYNYFDVSDEIASLASQHLWAQGKRARGGAHTRSWMRLQLHSALPTVAAGLLALTPPCNGLQ
jgi:hypothetical protein